MARSFARNERAAEGKIMALQNVGLQEASIDLRTPFSDTNFAPATLIDLLRYRAAHQSEHRAYAFLAGGEEAESSVDYGELDRRARDVAARLQTIGVSGGERVLLFYPPGLEYVAAFLGCLYAGAIAVPAYPPRLNRPLSRPRSTVADSRAPAALTTGHVSSNLHRR